jgi:predicted aldo/keto reductase-like oxidoreductase
MGIIGMKVYARGLVQQVPGYVSMEPYLRFALSQPITNIVIGCDDIPQLEKNVAFARKFTPMSRAEMDALIKDTSPYARQLMYYKP